MYTAGVAPLQRACRNWRRSGCSRPWRCTRLGLKATCLAHMCWLLCRCIVPSASRNTRNNGQYHGPNHVVTKRFTNTLAIFPQVGHTKTISAFRGNSCRSDCSRRTWTCDQYVALQALQHERPHSESVQHRHSTSVIGPRTPTAYCNTQLWNHLHRRKFGRPRRSCRRRHPGGAGAACSRRRQPARPRSFTLARDALQRWKALEGPPQRRRRSDPAFQYRRRRTSAVR